MLFTCQPILGASRHPPSTPPPHHPTATATTTVPQDKGDSGNFLILSIFFVIWGFSQVRYCLEYIVDTAAFKPELRNFPFPILIKNLSTSTNTYFQSDSFFLAPTGALYVMRTNAKVVNLDFFWLDIFPKGVHTKMSLIENMCWCWYWDF